MTPLYVIYSILTAGVIYEIITGIRLRARVRRLEKMMERIGW